VDFHFDSEIRLHTEPGKGWAINEVDAEGEKVGLDQIPWEWTLCFTATSCVLSDSIEISQPLNFKFKVTAQDGTDTEQKCGSKEMIEQRQVIRVQLRSGDSRVDDNYDRQTTYSMFGTKRTIKKFELNIHQLANPDEQERCSAWGCPSYTSEGADFIDETTDDCIVFYLAVKPEAFARYVAKVDHGLVDEMVLRVGQVDGFYSEWSPSISTDKVKVLTSDKEHKVTLPSGHQSEPPRLGRVGEVQLYINRHLEFGKRAPEAQAVEEMADIGAERGASEMPAPAAMDPQMLQMLRSLRRAAWFVVSLLALIFIVTLLRR
jgi:hypothetical protein